MLVPRRFVLRSSLSLTAHLRKLGQRQAVRRPEIVGPEIVDVKRPTGSPFYTAMIHITASSSCLPATTRTNRSVLSGMYRGLYKLNVGVDFIFPDSTNLSNYKVIVVPPLYIASDDLLNKLADYVHQGGHVVMAFKSGFCNEYSTVRWSMAPGPLRKAAGFRYQEFSNLRQPVALKGDPFQAGADNRVSDWAEMLILEGAQPLAYTTNPFFGKYPAIARNHFGAGTLTYEGSLLSPKLQEEVLLGVLKLAGLSGPDQQLPQPVRVKHGVNRKANDPLLPELLE